MSLAKRSKECLWWGPAEKSGMGAEFDFSQRKLAKNNPHFDPCMVWPRFCDDSGLAYNIVKCVC